LSFHPTQGPDASCQAVGCSCASYQGWTWTWAKTAPLDEALTRLGLLRLNELEQVAPKRFLHEVPTRELHTESKAETMEWRIDRQWLDRQARP